MYASDILYTVVSRVSAHGHFNTPYSRKYWRELNLAVDPKIAIARILADLNLAVWYGSALHIYNIVHVGNFDGF